MKSLFQLMLLIPIFSFAQTEELPKFEHDTLYTTSGFKMYEGLEIKIGVGSMPDGDFKFIRTNANSLFAYNSTTGYQGLANQANSLPRKNSGLKYKVKDIVDRGSKKKGHLYYVKIGTGLINYEIDVDNAIASGELVVPAEFKPKAAGQILIAQTFSLADELTKLRKLYSDSILTKEEYEAQKKKLLEKQ